MRDSNVRRASAFHKHLFRLTGGRFGKRLVDNDMLLLTTRGRVSGKPHSVPLLYLENGASLVVIASYGGRDLNPDWYLNLVETPQVEVQLPRRKPSVMMSRTAHAEERRGWWPKIVDAYDGYAVYQSRTKREIPVVILEPA